MEDDVRRSSGSSPSETRARDGAIRTAIGRMLAAQYDLAEPLSERLESLLRRFENIDEIRAVDIQRPHIRVGSAADRPLSPQRLRGRQKSSSNRGDK
jgi:hypothetical protein